jgi:hypothetical protein
MPSEVMLSEKHLTHREFIAIWSGQNVSGKGGPRYFGGKGVIAWRVGGFLKTIQAACGSCERPAFFQLSGVS